MMGILAGIVLALSLFGNVKQHDRIEQLETKTELLAEIANDNAQQAHVAAEVARENENTIDSVVADFNQCTDKLRSFENDVASFDRRREVDTVATAELEKRLTDSDHDVCSVPRWLADEITGNSDSDQD